ncbi:non-ribosomal peptide synthetase [Pseudomonas sp. McL0111]|uniref:non-ribosomal peptide synthetase n=1 Tax=Pseudomonas sp. McL0111 TaxID=3457357 RepID=UPI00403E4604
MNAEDSLKLARRFIGLPLEKRQMFLAALQKEGVDFARFPIPAGIEAEDRQALSYAQQRMWFLWQLDPQSGAYNLPGAVRLSGQLNLAALEQSFASLVERHETLRTVFQRQPDDSLRQVPATAPLIINHGDFSPLPADEREQAVSRAAEQQSVQPFDLATGPLLRVSLLKLGADEHVLLLTLHHIVSDGWSMNVLIDEFIHCYDAFDAGAQPQLAALPVQYSDYALWQRRWLEAGEQARQLQYWQAQLGDEHPVLELPLDHSRPAVPSYRGTRYEFAVDGQLAEQLRNTAQKHQVTLFMLLLGAFNALLHRYTGQTDIRIGVPIANRNRAEIEGLIGFFVNTQVLRTQLDGQTQVDDLLRAIKETALGAQAHQDLPFERLVEALKLERSLSHTPLFQVMYNHQPQVADLANVGTASGLSLSSLDWQSRTTQFDLSLDTWEKGGKLHAALTYASDLFDATTIERMARHWTRLLQAMVADTSQRVGELPLLDAAEQHTLVHDWNNVQAVYPTGQPIHHLIEAQVARNPDAPALVFGENTLTYARLDARANQLAHLLREQGVQADSLVGICVERSVEMVVGLLAILKAGGAYVPLDPEYPQERLAYMVEDSGITLLLTQSSLLSRVPTDGVQVIILDQEADWLDRYSESRPQVVVDPLNLAYVIYTSGSTGKPKGAGNSHAALVNRLSWMQEAYALDGSDSVLQKTPFSFDVSVWEFFWPLLTGARLVVAAPGAHRDPLQLIETINRHAISTLHFVPSMLQAFIHEPGVESCAGLKRIVCSGEALPLDAQQQVFAKLPNAHLYNLYGPTEAAIDVTHWTCVDEGADSVPIGRPIANLRTHVLDAELLPVPSGVAGELYLGGAGLARSYHQRPALTAERFVPCPFHDGARLYRTGDRVRQRADGVIEYLGRLDHQVKLRGLRIELGEIETRLMQHPLVREAVVLVQGGKHLVAYLVLENAQADEQWQQDVKAWLLGSLPEFMVPTYLMTLARLPVTANGKLDRKALPQPDAASQQAFVAPQDTMQMALAAIWEDVLGLERVGLEDNFFELGGDSIISIQVVSRARQAGIRISPRDLFQYQTVRSLALVAKLDSHSAIDQGPVTGEALLGPIQQQFFSRVMPLREHWNQSLLLTPREPLNAQRLDAALTRVLNHHDALRLRFVEGADGWQQVYGPQVESADLWQRDAESTEQLTALCDAAQRSLELANGPLLRALLVTLADGTQRLSLILHHLVVDGVSWRVLLEDLQQAYEQLAAGGGVQLPAKTSAFQSWTQRLSGEAARFDDQLAYWKTQHEAAQDLPCERPQGSLQNVHGQKIEWRLDAERTRQLLQQAPAAYRTQVNDLLLTALARTVSRWSKQPGTLIQLEGHGREDLFDDIDLTRTVGWFTSLFALNLTCTDDLDGSIKSIKEQLRAVPDKGLGYGVLRYLAAPHIREELAALPQPRITFNYLGQFDRQFDEQALLVPATESGGAAQDQQAPLDNWLTVEGQVYGGELSLSWGFSREMFDVATVQRLADDYAAELGALIEHCCALEAPQATPSDFPLARISQAQLDALPVAAAAIEDLYPLSPMQQGMLFHTLYEPQVEAYISQMRLDIQGLDPQRFAAAWQAVLERHDVLRSSFHWQGLNSAHQVISRQVVLPLELLDGSATGIDTAALADAERARGFDLDSAPLLRLKLVRTAADAWHLIYTSHHILMDGWSNAQLLGEVISHYATGRAQPAPVANYRDYMGWLQQQSAVADRQFWDATLAPLQAPTLLADAMRAPVDGQGSGEYRELIDEPTTRRLGEFARQQKVTLNTLLQAAWSLLLQRYTGQDCVVFGATVAGRSAPLPGIEQQLGLFINTLPLVCNLRPDHCVGQWLSDLQAQNLALREYEHVPLYDIQGWAGQQGSALFDSLLVFENFPVAEALKQGAPAGLTFGNLHNHERTHYPLTLGIELGASLSLELGYDAARFSAAQVQTLCANLRHLLEQLVASAQTRLGALQLLDATALRTMLAHCQPPAVQLQQQGLVHERIAAQARVTPQALAVQAGELRLSYGELNVQANRLAHRLLASGAAPGKRVGLALHRSPQMIVSLLAVLKTGAAYVPLDSKYPTQRLAYMIEDSRLDLLLSESGLLDDVALPTGLVRLDLTDITTELAAYPDSDPQNTAVAADLAYVIYTSGSTGQPKGVAIDHAALQEFCQTGAEYSLLEAQDRVLQFATFSFDGFVEQCYPPLCVGAALILRGDELWDVTRLADEIVRHDVTLADLPAAYWFLLARECASGNVKGLGKLRQVHVGGEAMSVEGLRLWHEAGLGHVRLLNTYGPTEATVVSSVHECRLSDASDSFGIPIGRAIAGRALYVLDSAGQLLPAGGVGELCIGAGACLAQQYFDRPALTAERFLPDPFAREPGARLYRSGDLARYNQNGDLEYAGRIDHQVKIRGFRIEMGEIEACLQALDGVRAAAVIAQEFAGGAQLVACVVAETGREPALGEAQWLAQIKAALQQALPDYMVPAHLLALAALPLNNNGKLDRAALPKIDFSLVQTAYVAPQTLLQVQLADIWQAVLESGPVGLDDHFFERGGHSLLATQVISRVRQVLKRDVPMRTLFEHPTLQGFATACSALQHSESLPMLAVTRGEGLRLSYAQERQWFLWQLEPDSAAYHVPSALRLHGPLDIVALQHSFEQLVARHEPLRTTFRQDDERTVQIIHPQGSLLIEQQTLPQTDAGTVQHWVQAQISQPFDLLNGPLLRVSLLRVAADEHVLVITQHHIVSDGWSMQVMVRELMALYAAQRSGQSIELPALTLQYADFAQWQRQWMDAGERQRQLDYWVAQLGGEQPVLELPLDHSRPAVQSYRGARQDLALEPALSTQLHDLARSEGVTLFMLLLASFQTLLHRYSGQDDVRVGVPIANRNRAETEGLIGFFVNTQVMRARFDGEPGFRDLLMQTRQAALGAQAHQDLPFEQLVEALAPERSLSHSPLFQVLFNHQSTQDPVTAVSDLRVEGLMWNSATAQFDLTLDTTETDAGLMVSLTYASDLFDAATISRLLGHWQALLRGIVAAPQQAVQALPMLDAEECQTIIQDWNATATDYPLDRSVQQLIEAQVLQTPDAPALVFAETRLSYAELNARANQLAHKLIGAGVGQESLVGIAAERSIEMVVGLLAVLKAGGAYVPLDPEYPQDRLRYMIEDSGVQLLLTQAHLVEALPLGGQVQTLLLDAPLGAYPTVNPQVIVDGENLAYVIYTSGSTGKPKGAGNRHVALTNRLCWMQQAYAIGAGDSVLQKTPFSFDVSVWEFFWPLMTGARLVVAAPGDHRDPTKLVELINRERITTLHFVPSMLQAFLQDSDVATCASLQRIVCSGEALPADAQQQVFAKLPQAGLYNLYGPTEAAIDVTHWTCVEEGRDSVPIGQPIANLGCYILDDQLQPVPAGVLGELYLAGIGLARGYHQRPALTAERFAVSPFGNGERIYRTGDLARYRADGVIEYAGRIDHQVKLRGLRIELGEIEARLLEHADVREAAVLVIDGKHLTGYVVLAQESPDWRDALMRHLHSGLPEYMVPNQWLSLAQMPLSPNGKLDRKALPKPELNQGKAQYIAPRTELEQRIAAVWADVLKLERVGLSDNFFELGGDSIISIQVVARARQAGIRFTPKDLFQYQSVQALAGVATLGNSGPQFPQGPVSGTTPLLPFQQLFLESEIAERHHWNQSVLLKPAQNLDAAVLEQALQGLVNHHDALRLAFTESADGWTASHREPAASDTLLMQSAVADDEQMQAACLAAQRSFDLAQGPLLRGLLLTLADGSQRLLLAVHHLVVDGVSWRILLEDLHSAYVQGQQVQPLKLPAKTSAFKHWAERLQQHAPQRADELELWRAQLTGAVPDLPCNNPHGSLQNRHAHTVQTRLDQTLTRQLLQQAPAAYRTQVNDLLMTALARVICRWSGQPSTLIQLEGHGREDLFDGIDLSRTVGWFTSLFPVRLTPTETFDGSIKQIKEQLRAIPDKGLGFGVLRYFGDEATRRELAALPTPRITFNYLGQFDTQFDEAALFVPASERGGDEQSALAPLGNWLELNGQVYAGELSLGWTFSREMFDDATVQRLADDYAAELAALIAHCCDPQHAGITPSDFPLAPLSQNQLDALPGAGADVEDIYPLSPMQQGMLFHSLYEQGSGDYINQMRVSVQGLDAERLRQAWQAAVDSHSILRTRFVWISEQEQPLQIVQRQAQLPFSLHDWRGRSDLVQALDSLAQEQLQQGFDLLQAPLLRLVLVRTGEDSHEMLYTSHHILMDGWSNSQLLGEVLQRYAGETPLAPVGRYADYIGWLQRQDSQASERFWSERLADLDEPTHLARSCLDNAAASGVSGYAQHTRLLDTEQTLRLGEFARQQKVTLNTLVQAAWLLLLQRYTGQQTVAFGATVAGRPAELPGIEQQVGLFINTLPVIARPRAEQSLGDWLQSVQALNLAMRDFEYTPLADIQRWSGQRGEGLFDSLLVFENYPVSAALNSGAAQGLRFGQASSQEQTNLPLTVLVDMGESLSLQFAYACQHFSAAQIEQIGGHLLHLLQQMAVSPAQRRLSEIGLFDAVQQQAVLRDWNREPATFAQTCTLQQLIEAQVRQSPNAIAVSLGDEQLTYGELNIRANRLAHGLIARGVGADVLVGLAAERSIEMIVGLVAILKAGGAYLPLDPQYPAERLQYMIEDSEITLLLMQPGVLDHLELAPSVETLLLGDDATWQAQPANDPQVWADSASLAYVIYTSGSTGKPKGTLLAHDNVLRLFEATDGWFGFGAEDRWTLFHSYAFDFSVWEIFGALLHGGRLVIVPHTVSRSPQEFYELLCRERITVLNQTPSAFKQLMQVACDTPQAQQPSLRYVVFGGEALEVRSLRPWFERFGDSAPQLINMYGITETTVHVTYRPLSLADLEQDAGSPLGDPIPDLGWYVLDADLNPVARGCIGELHVSGAGLARGYLKRADLSALRFVPNPFGDVGARLYRTGDLARYRADGRIEYAGRIDHQVKIRGFRIELGEIEAQLLALPQIRQAVVLDQPGAGGVQLVAYLVADQSVELDQQGQWREHLRQALKHNLPDYMVPAHLLLLDSLPLTANGKLDRKALPQPDASLLQNVYVAPQSELQQQIAGVWAEVLKLERVGLSDNFFELGGHSLLATQVALRLRELLGFEIPLASLFASADLAAFCAAVQALQPDLQPVHDVLAKSLEALNRLSADELEKLIS